MSKHTTNSHPGQFGPSLGAGCSFSALAGMVALTGSLLLLGASCNLAADDEDSEGVAGRQTSLRRSDEITANGITANGITANGITANGITANGITANGVTIASLRTTGLGGHGDAVPGGSISRAGLDGMYVNGIGIHGVRADGTGSNRIIEQGLGSNGVVMPGIGLIDTGQDLIGLAGANGSGGGFAEISVNGFYLHGDGVNGLVVAGHGLADLGLDGLVINGADENGVRTHGIESNALVLVDIDPARQVALDTALYHLAGCALSAGQSITITWPGGVARVYRGVRGLAPEWRDQPLQAEHEKSVLACLESSPGAVSGLALGPAQERGFYKLVEYLASCALRDDQTVTIYASDGTPRRYTGLLGLAPEWQSQLLGPEGQRAVSACLAARVNALGRTVVLSLRGPGLTTGRAERALYTRYEGGFWGNVFADPPYLATCVVDGGGLSGRVCADGKCGFTHLGSCADVCARKDATEGYYADCDGEVMVASTFLSLGQRSHDRGQHHDCAVGVTGNGDQALSCWGRNDHGQLGDKTTISRVAPVAVSGLDEGVVETRVGETHSCARKSDGSLWCWGDNSRGQLGDGTLLDHHEPQQVGGLGFDVAALHAGRSHTCALGTDGSVWCWGDNEHGQLGDRDPALEDSEPARLDSLGSGVAGLSASRNASHTCAIRADGSLWCWGENGRGQLGDGTTTDRNTPVAVDIDQQGAPFGEVTQVCSTANYTCSRKVDATLWCWGNGHGARPMEIVSAAGVVPGGLTCDTEQVCARGKDTAVRCHAAGRGAAPGRPE